MKVLFLDHDGVLCLYNNFGTRYKKQKKWRKKHKNEDWPVDVQFDNFDKKAIKTLNEIIEATDCEIVVTSDWRRNLPLSGLEQLYEHWGIAKKPIDKTTDWRKGSQLELNRMLEIKEWLMNNKCDSYVTLDDLQIKNVNLVHCPLETEGIKQSGIKEKVIAILNDTKTGLASKE